MENVTNFCGECGTTLSAKNAKICVKCGSDPHTSENYCVSCGEKLKSKNAVICLKCGVSIKDSAPLASKKDAGIATVIGALGFLIISPAAGYFLIPGKVAKGIIYLIVGWIMVALSFLCLVPFLFLFVVVYDVYLEETGKKAILPG